jgi:hypothetical protein
VSLTHFFNDLLCSEHGGASYPLFFCFGTLSIALQSCNYVSYGHLNVSVIYGRGKDVWPVAIIRQILLKNPDWTFIGSGGDKLEQPFNPWCFSSRTAHLVASKSVKSFLVANEVSKMSFLI